MMNWEKLLCRDRFVRNSKKKKRKYQDLSNEFEKDVNRIMFIYPFRRMQHKTQVVPLPAFDFIHTRLTHTLEVATVGKILGRIVGAEIIKRHPELRDKKTTDNN